MRALILTATLVMIAMQGHAAGNRALHCHSENAELAFHTVFYGEVAVGEYTVLNGEQRDLDGEKVVMGEGPLMFENQGRIFRVMNPKGPTPLEFELRLPAFDGSLLIETGVCEEVS